MATIALFGGWLFLFLSNGFAPGWYGALFVLCPLLLRLDWAKSQAAKAENPKIARAVYWANTLLGIGVLNSDFGWISAAVFTAGFAASYWLVNRPLFETAAN